MKIVIARTFLVISVLLTVACHEKRSTNGTIVVDTTIFSNPKDSVKKTRQVGDTLSINYEKNKAILDLIPLIPDSAMESWEWSKTDRLALVDMVKANNYYVDTTPQYNNIRKVTPQYFKTQVVDGSFVAACYKVNDGSWILITCDIVGDGKNIQAYRIWHEEVTALNVHDIIRPISDFVLLKAGSNTCSTQLKEAEPYADYDFTTPDTIEISLPLTKAQTNGCLKGNVAKLVFDPIFGKFELQNTAWY